jgi:signal transduction histidine kinase
MDVRTLYSIVGVLFFITPVAVLYVLRSHRDKAALLWCGSWLSFGITSLLIAARDLIPSFLSFHLAHLFLVVSYIGRTASITWELSETRQAWHRSIQARALIGAVYLVLFSLLFALDVSDRTRFLFVNAFSFATFVEFFVLTIQLSRRLQNRGSLLISIMAAMFAFGFATRFLGVLFDAGEGGVFSQSIDQTVVFLSAIVGYICGNFGFLQIRIERMLISSQQALDRLKDATALNAELDRVLAVKNDLLSKLSRSSGAAQSGVLVSAIVHEITQPLGALTLNAEFLRRKIAEGAAPPNLSAVLDDLLASLRRINEAVDSVRQIFMRKEPSWEAVDLGKLLREIIDLVHIQAKQDRIELSGEICNGIIISGHMIQLRMVFLNLLQNAIAALRENSGGRRIIIRLEQREDTAVISIADNGPGIAAELAPRIWELYVSEKPAGTGIGLWLSRLIVEHHHGSIQYSKLGLGGAEFVIRLPLPHD